MQEVGITKYCEVMCEEGRQHKVYHKVFHKVFHKVLQSISHSSHKVFQKVLQSIVGSGVRKGGGHTDLRRSVKVPASSACNLHEENQLFENKLNDVLALCGLVSKGFIRNCPLLGRRA